MATINARLATLESRPGSRIPHFIVELADVNTVTQGESAMLTETGERMGATKTEVIVKGIEAVKAELDK